MTAPVFRFAPSPNGELHLGHALSALLNADLARQTGGRLLLRIEDIDPERSTREFATGIFRDLEWLGIEWEEPVRRQSEHMRDYLAALEALQARGLAYPAFMSRGEARAAITEQKSAKPWPRDPDGAPLYPGRDRELSKAERLARLADYQPFAWRLDMEAAFRAAGGPLAFEESGSGPDGESGTVSLDPRRWGDVAIARMEAPTSYHLSVTLDDALQGVSHVVRGQDLFHATAVHRLLQALLGLPTPIYRHHRLILGEDGRKLSKSRRDASLRALREAGRTPDDIRRMVGLTS